MDRFTKFVINASAFLAVAVILVGIGMWVERVSASIKDIEVVQGDVETLTRDVETLKGDVETLTGDVKTLTGDVETLTGDVKTLKGDVKEINGHLHDLADAVTSLTETSFQTVEGSSPRALTQFGKQLSEDIGGRDLVEPFASELAAEAGGLEPYDIQDLSLDYIRKRARTDVDLQRRIKEGAYRNGISKWAVVGVLGLELRDALLESKDNQIRRSH